ncbi:hypothetical protein [uncultured Acetobacteroides sp.]|uniref:hypothetical protein n=1 Tax=uncultured Acetobacteroides sp. TaxID=1760811 RepID=UPI0029F52918|nr:hypothetical protein [uncultured Acetobacteroides sp.]
MAYTLYGELKFPANNGRQGFKIRRFSAVKIETSWQSLTDTAEITLPRKTRDFNRFRVTDWFREGDPVEIWLGCNDKFTLEFSGYIAKVPVGIPLVLELEDEMYKLKRKTVSISLQNCSLKKLLQTIAPGYEIQCDETKMLGTVRFSKMAASAILDELKKTGIHSWFEGKVLHAASIAKSSIPAVKVVIEKCAAESLKQKSIENTLVTISLIRKKGKKLKVEYGDKGAGKTIHRTLSGINLSEAEMMAEAKKIYHAVKVPGLDGDVTLFGNPRVQHGMRMELCSWLYPEKNGLYYIDAVTKTFDGGGFRQVCKLGDKAV